MKRPNTFTRKELYELVWKTPLSQLALQYNIPDEGIRKICIKYQIPLPKSGHWTKLRFKKKVIADKLPEYNEGSDVKIMLTEGQAIALSDSKSSELNVLANEIELNHPKIIVVPSRISEYTKLVKETKDVLDKQRASKWRGYELCIRSFSSRGTISMEITKKIAPRALRFINSFIKLAEKRSHIVTESYIEVNGEKFKFRVREKHNRIKRDDSRFDSSDLVPNGKLSLKFDDLHGKEWYDGRKPLEEQLSRIMAFFEIRSRKDKIKRAEIEEWHRQYNIEKEKEKKIRIEQENEDERFKQLLKDAESWEQSNRLNLFIDEVSKRENNDWAKMRVKRLDPLCHGMKSFYDKYELKNKYAQ